MRRSWMIITLAGICILLLGGGCIAFGLLYKIESEKNMQLLSQLDELTKEEKRSAIEQSISKQMEQIAHQQELISDEQREEALRQQQKADEERQKALVAMNEAEASEKKALQASAEAKRQQATAEEQRQRAVEQQHLAEYQQQVADTLRYQALGQSLGSLSTIQQQAGNDTLANLLAYASYYFTKNYGGDLYTRAVLHPLIQASHSMHQWSVHKGVLTAIDMQPGNDNILFTVSEYGEIMRHTKKDGKLTSQTLLEDPTCDFRNVYVDEKGTAYAISRSGVLVTISSDNSRITRTIIERVVHPSAMTLLDKNTIVTIGENGLAYIDINSLKQTDTELFDYKITSTSRWLNYPIFFDNKGKMHIVEGRNNIQTKNSPVKGTITAFAYSEHQKLSAYGTLDGTIYLVDSYNNIKKLESHRSRISRLKFNGQRLYSSSYDGTMNLWITPSNKIDPTLKIDPMELFATNGWILYFTSDSSKNYIWTGDQNGKLTETLISIPMMVERIKGNLKRNLTRDEWNYYIGSNVAYRTFMK